MAGLAVVFLVLAVGFIPATLALAASCFLIRAALFLCMMPFLVALSMALWALLWAVVLALRLKSFRALFRTRLVLLLRTAAFLATRTRFLADLMIGIGSSYLLWIRCDYNRYESVL